MAGNRRQTAFQAPCILTRGGRIPLKQAAARSLIKDGPLILFAFLPGTQLLTWVYLGAHLLSCIGAPIIRPFTIVRQGPGCRAGIGDSTSPQLTSVGRMRPSRTNSRGCSLLNATSDPVVGACTSIESDKLAPADHHQRPMNMLDPGSSRSHASVLAGDRRYRIPEELRMFVDRLFQNALLIAVRAEALGGVLFIDHRAHTVALNALRTQKGHIGRTRAHNRQSLDSVDLPVSRFNQAVRVTCDRRGRRGRSLIARLRHQSRRRGR